MAPPAYPGEPRHPYCEGDDNLAFSSPSTWPPRGPPGEVLVAIAPGDLVDAELAVPYKRDMAAAKNPRGKRTLLETLGGGKPSRSATIEQALSAHEEAEGGVEVRELLEVWRTANAKYFDGKLEQPAILVTAPGSPRALGDYVPKDVNGLESRIRISPAVVKRGALQRQWTLVHEMIHQWQWEVANLNPMDDGYRGHGAAFCEQANRINRAMGWTPDCSPKGRAPGTAKPEYWPDQQLIQAGLVPAPEPRPPRERKTGEPSAPTVSVAELQVLRGWRAAVYQYLGAALASARKAKRADLVRFIEDLDRDLLSIQEQLKEEVLGQSRAPAPAPAPAPTKPIKTVGEPGPYGIEDLRSHTAWGFGSRERALESLVETMGRGKLGRVSLTIDGEAHVVPAHGQGIDPSLRVVLLDLFGGQENLAVSYFKTEAEARRAATLRAGKTRMMFLVEVPTSRSAKARFLDAFIARPRSPEFIERAHTKRYRGKS